MTVRDALRAAIVAHIGPALEDGHVVHPWWSATFEGERHCFRYGVSDSSAAVTAARGLREREIALHTGFFADADVRPVGPSTVEIEMLVVAE